MLHNLRTRLHSEDGFTLIELLVVILIIGILAAIALPAFLNQREKGQDAEAKTDARSAATALETYATERDGQYTGATAAALQAIEPTLVDAQGLAVVVTSATQASVTVTSTAQNNGRTFTITRNGGATTRTCAPVGGGCNAPNAAGNGW